MLLSDLPHVCGYQDGVARVSGATIVHYGTSVSSFVRWLGDDRVLDLVTAVDTAGYHSWLRDEAGITVRSANSYRRTLRALFNRVGRQDLARPLKNLRPPPREGKAISEADLARVLAVAPLRDVAMILFMRDSGVRREVVTRLRKDDLKIWESDDGDWRVAARVLTKGDTTVLALAGHQCALALRLWLDVQPSGDTAVYVFTAVDGSQLAPGTINSVFRRLKRSARLSPSANMFPHALRHRFAHEMLSRHDAKIVSQLMGHSDVTVTLEIYGHRNEDELMAAYFGDGS